MPYGIRDGSCCEKKCCDKKPEKLEILGGKCIEVDKSVPNVYKINNKSNVEITSSDESVYIKQRGDECDKRFDLSVACEDKKVGVCDTDTPGYLKDKINVSSCLTLDTICPEKGSKGYGTMTLGIDYECLQRQLKDEKVAVEDGCKGDYLNNVLDADNDFVKFEVKDCKMTLVNKDKGIRPLLKVRLIDTVVGEQEVGPGGSGSEKVTGDYVLLSKKVPQKTLLESTHNLEIGVGRATEDINGKKSTNGFNEFGQLIVPMDGYYRVSYGGTCEWDYGIVARRIYLYHDGPGSNRAICLENRGAGGGGHAKPGETRPLYNYGVPLTSGGNTSYGLGHLRSSFGGSTIVGMKKGDTVCFGMKINTALDDPNYDYSKKGHFQMQGEITIGSGGADEGAYYTLEWIRPLD